MDIQLATRDDHAAVQEISDLIYPDGDYIANTWDRWLADGSAYVGFEDGKCMAVCNITLHERQMWTEGMRIHPDYTSRGYGTQFLRYGEDMARKNGGIVSRSFVEPDNHGSLALNRKNGYSVRDTWNGYEIKPKLDIKEYKIVDNYKIDNAQYVDSWRVYDLQDTASVIFLDGAAVMTLPSRYFSNSGIMTVLHATDTQSIIPYISEKIHSKKDTRRDEHYLKGDEKLRSQPQSKIRIVSKLDESLFEENFKKFSTYCLVEKRL